MNPGEINNVRLLVAVGHTARSAELLVYASELAKTMHASSIQAVYVENTYELTQRQRKELDYNARIAKQLGIEFRIISNYDTVKGIAGFALQEHITHIVIDKPKTFNLLSLLRWGNFVINLIRNSEHIHVCIFGFDTKEARHQFSEKTNLPSFTSGGTEYVVSTLVVVVTIVLCYWLNDLVGYNVVSFVLLFVVSILAFAFGTGPILLASALSALSWNFYFIPPNFTFHINNTEDVLMFFMFFIIALLNGVLTSRIRRQEMRIRKREERTHALYSLTRELSEVSGSNEVKNVVMQGVKKHFRVDTCILLQEELKNNQPASHFRFTSDEWDSILYCHEQGLVCGKFTDQRINEWYSYFPLIGTQLKIGVLVMKRTKQFTYGEEQFWNAYLGQVSGKFEREMLRDVAQKAYMLDASDRLYKTLFNSISHELRIPVTAVMGASDTLLAQRYPEKVQKELLTEINIASVRLNHLIENLLNMSRLESGRLSPRYDWCDVHDLINRVIETLHQELYSFSVNIQIPDDLPLVKLDFGLMEQVLHNLLLNSAQHAPLQSLINLEFSVDGQKLIIIVYDNGPGFPDEELDFVFDKFYRGKSSRTGGTGLGLSIVKGFVEAHKGHIAAANHAGGGAQFTIQIPIVISEITDFMVTN